MAVGPTPPWIPAPTCGGAPTATRGCATPEAPPTSPHHRSTHHLDEPADRHPAREGGATGMPAPLRPSHRVSTDRSFLAARPSVAGYWACEGDLPRTLGKAALS